MGNQGRVLACVAAGSAAIALGGCVSSGGGGGAAVASGTASAAGGTAPGGTAGRSAASLVAAMKTAVQGASSMHMAGQLPNGGRPVILDIGVLRAGRRSDGGLAGTITEGGVPLQLIGTGGQVYVKATRPFLEELRAASGVCAVLCGKYVQMSGPQGSQLTGSLGMASLIRSLILALPRLRRAGMTTVGGQPVIALRGADGSTLDVAARGKPYPLRLVAPRGREESVLFTQWDAVTAPAAPPASQVINLSQLKAGTG